MTLHVGLGTFRPVQEDEITDHKMHSEWYCIDEETANKIQAAKAAGRRVIAVGTTSCRTLEAVAAKYGEIRPCSGNTEIFLYPIRRDPSLQRKHRDLPVSRRIAAVHRWLRRDPSLQRKHRDLPVSRRIAAVHRWPDHQLPPAGKHPDHAGVRFLWLRKDHGSLPRSCGGKVSLLFLWRCYADSLIQNSRFLRYLYVEKSKDPMAIMPSGLLSFQDESV